MKILSTGIEPSRFHLFRLRVFFDLFQAVVRRLFSPFIRITVVGKEHVPRKGPILVLANHVGFLDPFVLPIAFGRPIQFLATPTVFRRPLLAIVAMFFGVVPKKKFHPDLPAIFKLIEWAELGSAVGIFPEGQRTWDSRTLQVVPGIGKLIRMLDAPVITARIYNADRQSPRWAVRQRRGRIIVHIDPPRRFTRKTKPAAIEEEIFQGIRVDPETSPRGPVYGRGLALGIGRVLFMCPSCFASESLTENGNQITCANCNESWVVGSDNILTLIRNRRRYPLLSAIDQIRDYLDKHGWIIDTDRFVRDGIALESRMVRLLDISGRRPKEVGFGNLQLTRDGLRLVGSSRWFLALSEILVATVDLATDLQFRSNNGLFSAVMPRESVVKWEWFVNHWLKVMKAGGDNLAKT